MWWIVGLGGILAAVIAIWWVIAPQFHVHYAVQQAKLQFIAERQALRADFFQKAASSGKPRGLIWVHCDWSDELLFAVARETQQIAAFVEIIIRFEAVPGGEMEDVEAVGNLRIASAVFQFQNGKWETRGEAIFNHSPHEAVARYGEAWQVVE